MFFCSTGTVVVSQVVQKYPSSIDALSWQAHDHNLIPSAASISPSHFLWIQMERKKYDSFRTSTRRFFLFFNAFDCNVHARQNDSRKLLFAPACQVLHLASLFLLLFAYLSSMTQLSLPSKSTAVSMLFKVSSHIFR